MNLIQTSAYKLYILYCLHSCVCLNQFQVCITKESRSGLLFVYLIKTCGLTVSLWMVAPYKPVDSQVFPRQIRPSNKFVFCTVSSLCHKPIQVLPVRYTSAGNDPWKHTETKADRLCFGIAGWLVLSYGHRVFNSPPQLPTNWWQQTAVPLPENGTLIKNGLYSLLLTTDSNN
jgi:hypothetical protein